MSLPPVDERGLLPPGKHDATWVEIEALFLFNQHRNTLYGELRRFVAEVLSPLPGAEAVDLLVGGSFLSDKEKPNDIEATIYVPWQERMKDFAALATLSEHDRIMRNYGIDFYVSFLVDGYNDFGLFFQYVGTKTAAAKGLHEKDQRGVIRIMQWTLG